MNEHTTTQCLLFPEIFDRPVVAKFDQSQGSSDGGAVLLKAQVLAVERIPTDQQLVDRIAGQPRRIVGVFISQCNGHDSLSNQLTQLMLHLTGLPVISQTSRQCRSQA